MLQRRGDYAISRFILNDLLLWKNYSEAYSIGEENLEIAKEMFEDTEGAPCKALFFLGNAQVAFSYRIYGHTLDLLEIAVAPWNARECENRQEGWGSAAMYEVFKEALSSGCKVVRALVFDSCEPFYLKLGMTKVGDGVVMQGKDLQLFVESWRRL